MLVPGSETSVKTKGGNTTYKCRVRCDHCNKVYEVSLQLARSKKTHRCRGCANKEKKNLHRIGVSPANKQLRCFVNCEWCGKLREKTKRQLQKTTKTFCNTSCQNKWQNSNTVFNKGENNPSYVDGSRVGGKTPNYGDGFTKDLKKSIKIRDAFECQCCGDRFSGNKSKFLDIHHKDLNKFNNDSSNLISLCKSCHTSIHWELKREVRKWA